MLTSDQQAALDSLRLTIPELKNGKWGSAGDILLGSEIANAAKRSIGPAIALVAGAGTGLSIGAIPVATAIRGSGFLQGGTFDQLQVGSGTSQLTFKANRTGPSSGYFVTLVDAAAFSIVLNGKQVTVNYRGPLNGNADSANTIATALNAHAVVKTWFTTVSGGAGNVAALPLTAFAGGSGLGLSVTVGGVEQDIVGTPTDILIPMVTKDFTGLAAGDMASVLVTSNGIRSNGISTRIIA